MSAILDPAGIEVQKLVTRVMALYHGDLGDAGATVGVLMARPGEEDDPDVSAVTLHGYPCQATIAKTPYKQRVLGVSDAVLTIDAKTWTELNEEQREALVDHELTHLALARDRNGAVKTDDLGRPRLTMVLHDWELGGFAIIAKRHKGAAPEVRAFCQVSTDYRQLLFGWADDQAPQDEQLFEEEDAAIADRLFKGPPKRRGRRPKSTPNPPEQSLGQ